MTELDYALVFAALPGAHMVLDAELRYVAANEAYLSATGSTLDELLGRKVFDVFPNDPDDPNNRPARMLRASLNKVLETGETDHLAHIPYRVRTADPEGSHSEERIWSATHVPLLDANGVVQHIVQHTVDVTALRREAGADSRGAAQEAGVLSRAEAVQGLNEQLDAERAQLLRLFEQAPGFLCFLRGEKHVFELANQSYKELVGRQDIEGKPLREVLPEIDGQGYFEILDGIWQRGEPFLGTGLPVQLVRGGEVVERHVDFVYQPVRDARGEMLGILVQGQDVTERREAELRSEEARRAAEAFAAELEAQSRGVQRALEEATATIQRLQARLDER